MLPSAPVHSFGIPTKFKQIGEDIDGVAPGDQAGYSVSLSANGKTIAVSSFENDDNGHNSGHVRIFELYAGEWHQVGAPIVGEAAGDLSGSSVQLSDDGKTIAIAAYANDGNGTRSGHVRIYENYYGQWYQVGDDIDGVQPYNESGGRSQGVALSADGKTLAIGSYNYGNEDGGVGQVRVFQNVNGSWYQFGGDILGEASGDVFGWSVGLSDDGNRLVTSGIYNDGNGFRSGHGRVYDFNDTTQLWEQVGSDIDGEAIDDHLGVGAAISADGNTVAFGAPYNDGGAEDSGHARVYRFVDDDWQQIGGDLDGEAEDDHFGHGVQLSRNGDFAAVVAQFEYGDSSAAHLYKEVDGVWNQIGNGIPTEDNTGHKGRVVALSEDGKIIAVPSILNDGNGTDSGSVRIFKVPETSLSAISDEPLSLNGLSVSDADSNYVQTTVSVTEGRLLFGSLNNVFIDNIDPEDQSITISGTVADVSDALSDFAYIAEPHFSGSDVLRISSTDDGPTPQTTTNTIEITVSPPLYDTAVNLSDGQLTLDNNPNSQIGNDLRFFETPDTLILDDFRKSLNPSPGQLIGGGSFVEAFKTDLTQPILINLSDTYNIVDAFGIDYSLHVFGGKDEDIVTGGDQRDRLFGKDGDDDIDGGAGDDFIRGGAGADYLRGGEGIDTLDYTGSNEGVQIDLASGTASGGHAWGDSFYEFEEVFGSNHHDQLKGDSQNNLLVGRGGDDWIEGQDGRDTIRGGAGYNTLDGGFGIDTVDYRDTASGVYVDLQGEYGNGALFNDSVRNFENVHGSAFDDFIYGDDNNNLLIGYKGDDNLEGYYGNDILRGGEGADSLYGGDGKDTADYRGSSAAVNVLLEYGYAYGGDGEGDSLYSIERLTGSQFDDLLVGNDENNTLKGEKGNDILEGLGGADILRGGLGGDTLLGGAGRDTFDVRKLSESLLDNYDVIGDLNANQDKIKGQNPVASIARLGTATGLSETEIAGVLNQTDFVSNGAATFTVNSVGTFLALNDGNSGFQANSDAIIEITGFTGSLNNLTIV